MSHSITIIDRVLCSVYEVSFLNKDIGLCRLLEKAIIGIVVLTQYKKDFSKAMKDFTNSRSKTTLGHWIP
jgi:hypothetical protein